MRGMSNKQQNTGASWDIDQARDSYAIDNWSAGYFDINAAGELVVCLPEQAPLALSDIVAACLDSRQAMPLRLPLLLRFPQILVDRARRLRAAFATALEKHEQQQTFTLLYPVKVNQQHSVVSTLAGSADDGLAGCGLEVGSKPELMIALAMAQPGSTLVCNGYKDRDFIRLALQGGALGLQVVIIVEQPDEIRLIEQAADELGLVPCIGVRARLASLGAGNWQNTGGERAKFGLSPSQMIALVERLRKAGNLHWLRLLHFHMGSQIANLRDIRKGITEAARLLVALRQMQVPIELLDIGGGLGVDYEGSRSRSACSMNYSVDQYADSVVAVLSEICAQADMPLPRLLSESGRALTAHHAVLVTSVVDSEAMPGNPSEIAASSATGRQGQAEHELIASMHALLQDAAELPAEELWLEASTLYEQAQQAFLDGQAALQDRAHAEQLYFSLLRMLLLQLDPRLRRHRELEQQLRLKLADKYFINLSIFQSLPDIWALQQIFPVAPLSRLHEQPDRRAVLEDLTCDSDGRIERFVDLGGVEDTLRVHALRAGEDYLLGIFMSGAYQETLGDMHNLFGDTDSVDVMVADGVAQLQRARGGDSAAQLLQYVGYDPAALQVSLRQRMTMAGLSHAAAQRLQDEYEQGLQAHTYLRTHGGG